MADATYSAPFDQARDACPCMPPGNAQCAFRVPRTAPEGHRL